MSDDKDYTRNLLGMIVVVCLVVCAVVFGKNFYEKRSRANHKAAKTENRLNWQAQKSASAKEFQDTAFSFGQDLARRQLDTLRAYAKKAPSGAAVARSEKIRILGRKAATAYHPGDPEIYGGMMASLFHEIAEEHALCISSEGRQAEADPDWKWYSVMAAKISKMDSCFTAAVKAEDDEGLQKVRVEFQALKAEVEAEFNKGPPK